MYGFKDVPLDEITSNPEAHLVTNENTEIYLICRLGNDSQIAANSLREYVQKNTAEKKFIIKDVIGGLRAWSRDVDPLFPVY